MKTTKKMAATALVMLLTLACKKPTENIKLVVDTDILKYTALIYVTDGSNGGPAPADATITLIGGAADDIYELSGKKDIKLSAGIVTIGLDPNIVPIAGNPLRVNVQISAAGYQTEVKEVVFAAEQRQQTISIALRKAGSTAPPVVLPPPPVYDNTVSLTFTGRCPNRGDLEVRPSVYVFFRETGSGTAFQYLGYMNKGNINSKLILLGKTYDFQIVFGGEAYQVSQKIEQLSYDLSLDMGAACNL
jgi:hypothetical protein